MKIYSIAVTAVCAIALILVGYFGWYAQVAKSDKESALRQWQQTQDELSKNQEALTNLRSLVDSGLNNAKASAAILKDSSESFLIAGDIKIATLGAKEADAVSAQIQSLPEKMDRIALEQGWSYFEKSHKVSDYFAFARFLANTIFRNLANIH